MTIKFTNNATTTLASSINNSVTSLSVASGAGALFPSLSGSDVFYVTLANLTGSVEIVKVTARTSDTFTIVRGQDGTSALSWSAGDKVELRPVAAAMGAMAQTANNLSDLANAATARTNLGVAIGSDVQAYDSNTAKTNVVQSYTKAQRGTPVALTSSSNSIATDASLGNYFTHTFTENTTLANPTNLAAGQSGVIVFTQHASSPKTLAFGSYWKFPGGTAPSVTATNSAVDVLAYYVESTTRITAKLLTDVK